MAAQNSFTSPPEAFLRGSYVTALARGFVQRGTVDTEMSDRAGLTGRSLNDDNTAKTQQ